jgi:ABC-type Fe3+-siderophore transport system permease subunit
MNRISPPFTQGLFRQLLILFLMLAVLIVFSSGLGYMRISFSDVLRIVLAKILRMDSLLEGVNALYPVVITDVRLPRILTAASVGTGLALSGVVFQGILLNPLADPYTLGVSAGAALGASFALWLNIAIWGIWSVPLFAFIGAGLTLLAVIYLASSSAGLSSSNLILSGIIVSAIKLQCFNVHNFQIILRAGQSKLHPVFYLPVISVNTQLSVFHFGFSIRPWNGKICSNDPFHSGAYPTISEKTWPLHIGEVSLLLGEVVSKSERWNQNYRHLMIV